MVYSKFTELFFNIQMNVLSNIIGILLKKRTLILQISSLYYDSKKRAPKTVNGLKQFLSDL